MQKLTGLQVAAGNIKWRGISVKKVVEVLETVLSMLGVTWVPRNADLWVKLISDFRLTWCIDLIDALIKV